MKRRDEEAGSPPCPCWGLTALTQPPSWIKGEKMRMKRRDEEGGKKRQGEGKGGREKNPSISNAQFCPCPMGLPPHDGVRCGL